MTCGHYSPSGNVPLLSSANVICFKQHMWHSHSPQLIWEWCLRAEIPKQDLSVRSDAMINELIFWQEKKTNYFCHQLIIYDNSKAKMPSIWWLQPLKGVNILFFFLSYIVANWIVWGLWLFIAENKTAADITLGFRKLWCIFRCFLMFYGLVITFLLFLFITYQENMW